MAEHEPSASRPGAWARYPFADGPAPLPWPQAAARLAGARHYWLATVRPDGRPHVTPAWGVWLDRALYVDGQPDTRWARNVARNPACTVLLENGDEVVILEGVIEGPARVTETALAMRIVEAWRAKYGRLLPDPSGRGLFRVRPRSARAWQDASLEDGPRWQFPAP